MSHEGELGWTRASRGHKHGACDEEIFRFIPPPNYLESHLNVDGEEDQRQRTDMHNERKGRVKPASDRCSL